MKQYFVLDGIFVTGSDYASGKFMLPSFGKFFSCKKAVSFAKSRFNDFISNHNSSSLEIMEDYVKQNCSSVFYVHRFVVVCSGLFEFSISVVGVSE